MRKLAVVLSVMAISSFAMADILFDNGPLSTGNLCGGQQAPAGTTWSEVQPPGSIAGYGVQLSAGNRLADDFVVPAAGWNITDVSFFGYQTGSVSNTINNINLRIWNGVPGAAGATVVWGDTTTNKLNTAGVTSANMYRVFTGTPGTTRKIFNLPATVGTTLAGGTYWLDWQMGGTGASGPWHPQVTITGQPGKPGANGRQYTTTGWAAVVDGGVGQDLSFVVNGTVVPEPAALALLALGLIIRRR